MNTYELPKSNKPAVDYLLTIIEPDSRDADSLELAAMVMVLFREHNIVEERIALHIVSIALREVERARLASGIGETRSDMESRWINAANGYLYWSAGFPHLVSAIESQVLPEIRSLYDELKSGTNTATLEAIEDPRNVLVCYLCLANSASEESLNANAKTLLDDLLGLDSQTLSKRLGLQGLREQCKFTNPELQTMVGF